MKTTLLSLTTLFAFSAGVAFANIEQIKVAEGEVYNLDGLNISSDSISLEGSANQLINGGAINSFGTTTLTNAVFTENNLSVTHTGNGANCGLNGGFAEISGGKTTIVDGDFLNNTFTTKNNVAGYGTNWVYGGLF